MKAITLLSVCVVSLFTMQSFSAWGDAAAQEAPTVAIPKPGVPEIMTIEGTFVRAAYNNEG